MCSWWAWDSHEGPYLIELKYIYYFVLEGERLVPWHTWRSEDDSVRFCPSTFMWVLSVELRWPTLLVKSLFPVSYLTSPKLNFLELIKCFLSPIFSSSFINLHVCLNYEKDCEVIYCDFRVRAKRWLLWIFISVHSRASCTLSHLPCFLKCEQL